MGDTTVKSKAPKTVDVEKVIQDIYDIVGVKDLEIEVISSAQTDTFNLSSKKQQGALFGWKAVNIRFVAQQVRNMYYNNADRRRASVEIAEKDGKGK